ncbi:olfactory receptor 1009-like, partial [Python bivittatus]|uniref:Olfactory receptor n=1 Tax=Python bivittatus TaxID=176946 RepID=A0A9F2RCE6_PYTBI
MDISPPNDQNQTSVTEFLLMGFSIGQNNQTLLFVIGLFVYLLTLAGNLTIITLIRIDQHLQTPMYFFLRNLSFVEICYISTTLPKMLRDLLSGDKTISYIGCALQLYFFGTLGSTECVLLSAMAYDRYVAICHPLHYTILINQKVCRYLLAASWTIGHFNSTINTAMVFSLHFCHSNKINHFLCDILPLVRLSCSDIFISQMVTFTISGGIMIMSFSLILLSYILIVSSVLKIRTAHGRIKAFSTCGSHLTVVSIFYGSLMYTYIRPSSGHAVEEDRLISLLYTIITPLLNPLIYSFRSKELQGAFVKLLERAVYNSYGFCGQTGCFSAGVSQQRKRKQNEERGLGMALQSNFVLMRAGEAGQIIGFISEGTTVYSVVNTWSNLDGELAGSI